jgi:hypothetical protein
LFILSKWPKEFQFCKGFHHFRRSEFDTTLTEDIDIAAAAKAGGSNHPVHGRRSPIARGIPIIL